MIIIKSMASITPPVKLITLIKSRSPKKNNINGTKQTKAQDIFLLMDHFQVGD